MTNRKLMQNRDFYRSDPVACLLIEKLSLSPLSFGLLSIVFASGLYLLVAWLSGTLWSKPGQMGLLQDWFPWIWALFISPIVLGYYLWSFQAINKVIHDLEESSVLEINRAEVDQITFRFYNQKWRKLLATISAVSFSIFVFVTRFELKNSWTSSGPLPILTVTLATLVVVYMGSMLIINLITNVQVLHKILGGRDLNVNPLHPDRCGGLRSLSDYSLKTAYLAAILGIMVGFIEYQLITRGAGQVPWFIHLTIPIHIILSMACFFGPLLVAHAGMRRAKEELLHQIARQFQADYSQIHTSLTGSAETLKQGTEKIQELRAFYTLTDEFPVWPFNVQTFRRYLLTVPAPFLPVLFGLLQKLAGLLLKKWGIELSSF